MWNGSVYKMNSQITDQELSVDVKNEIEELRRLARQPYETPPALLQLRQRVSSERARTHHSILERVAKQAGVDLKPIFQEVQRRNAAKRRYVERALKQIEAEVGARAKEQKKRFQRIRTNYIRTFGKLEHSTPELKFHKPVASSSPAQAAQCNAVLGGLDWWTEPDPGNYIAVTQTIPDRVGIWLHPDISSASLDCDDTSPAVIFHELTYQLPSPATSFSVEKMRVDMIAGGQARSFLGDVGFLKEPNSLFVHSFIDMAVSIAQQVNGVWSHWPIRTERLFEGHGDYVKPINILLPARPFPYASFLHSSERGGGSILIHLQLVFSAKTIGSWATVAIDFRKPNYGIFIGGILLQGHFVVSS
jgi:hypothetical protein